MPPIFGVLFDGIAYGMLLFLLSVGLSVTLGMMNFVNLAHCSFAMLGGYVTVTLMNMFGWPFFATLPAAFVGLGHKFQIWEPERFRAELAEATAKVRALKRQLGSRVAAEGPHGARE